MERRTPSALEELPDGARVWPWILDALQRSGLPELAERITVVLDGRRYRTLASIDTIGELRISARPWALISEAEREDTIRHEVAHYVAFVRHGPKALNHGPLWQAAAVQCGARPQATVRATQELADVLRSFRKVKRVVAACGCSSALESAVARLERLPTGEHLLRPKRARVAAAGFATCYDCHKRLTVRGTTYVGGAA